MNHRIPLGIRLILATIIFTGLLAAGGLCKSQTNTNAPPSGILGDLQTFGQDIANSGLLTATNWSLDPYLTYAPTVPKNNRWGGGALAIYNVNNYLGTGIGFDYLGQFSMVSANIQLQAPTHPLTFLGGYATNVAVIPFVLGGIGTPFSGSAVSPTAITDVGGAIQFGNVWGGRFNTGVAWGEWSGAGLYSGQRYHAFLGWSRGF